MLENFTTSGELVDTDVEEARKTSLRVPLSWLVSKLFALLVLLGVVNFFSNPNFGNLVIAAFLVLFQGLGWLWERRRKRNAGVVASKYVGPYSIALSAEGLSYRSDHQNLEVKWSFVRAWRESEAMILIDTESSNVLQVPKRHLDDDGYASLLGYFEAHNIDEYKVPLWLPLALVAVLLLWIAMLVTWIIAA